MPNINVFEEYHSFEQNSDGPEIYDNKHVAISAAKSKIGVTTIYKAITTYQLIEVVFGTGKENGEIFKDVPQKGIYKIRSVD